MKHQQSTDVSAYESALKPIVTFNTIEDFWAIFQHFRRPTQITFGTTLHVFAEGIKPVWEDEQCKNGGQWALRVPKTHTNKYWEDLLLALIGDQFTDEGEVFGLVISLKPQVDTIQIWNKSGKSVPKIETLKQDILRILSPIEESNRLQYENFADTIAHFAKLKENGGNQPPKRQWNENQHEKEDSSSWGRGGRGGYRGGYRGRGGRGGHQDE